MQPTHDLMKKFKVEELGVKDFPNWIVAVRGKQITLGSCVILLKRPEPSMGGLTSVEAAEFVEVARWWEEQITSIFHADRVNYVAAMMKDPFVHFHAIARYKEPQEFEGHQFEDVDWPALIEFRDISTSTDILTAVVRRYQSAASV